MIELTVNGEPVRVSAEPSTPLLYVLRNDLGLRGTKIGCGLEQCRACTVIADGEAVTSCATAVDAFAGKWITTIEGLGEPGSLDPLQEAFVEEHAAQCGYCIPGILVELRALLDRNPTPTWEEVLQSLDGHLCRCGTHPRIVRAVKRLIGGALA